MTWPVTVAFVSLDELAVRDPDPAPALDQPASAGAHQRAEVEAAIHPSQSLTA